MLVVGFSEVWFVGLLVSVMWFLFISVLICLCERLFVLVSVLLSCCLVFVILFLMMFFFIVVKMGILFEVISGVMVILCEEVVCVFLCEVCGLLFG